jgi:hypothetical protein
MARLSRPLALAPADGYPRPGAGTPSDHPKPLIRHAYWSRIGPKSQAEARTLSNINALQPIATSLRGMQPRLSG